MQPKPHESSRAPAELRERWIAGRDIVVLGSAPWDLVRTIPQFAVMRLVQRNRVLVVEPFNSLLTKLRESRLQNRKLELNTGIRQLGENLWVYEPPPIGIPGHTRWRFVSRVNDWILSRLVARAIRRLEFRPSILWSFHFNVSGVIRRLQLPLSIYDCGDNEGGLARDPRHRALVDDIEQDTCRAADLVFTCTVPMGELKRPWNADTVAVTLGADLDFWRRALAPDTAVPDDLAALPGPILGYMGGVCPYKIDKDLVRFIAKARPDWTLAFVGYVWFGFDTTYFDDLPNVHFLGGKDYEAFPGYLKGMDVCLAPFQLNDVTRYGDSIKIYEYLAAGRPVVSTAIPASEGVGHPVRIANTPDAFVAAVASALEEGANDVQQRLAAVQPHSWDHHVARKSDAIREFLTRRNASRTSR